MTAIARAPLIISRFFFPNLFLVLERREGREKEGERNINVPEIHQSVAPRMPSTGAPVCDPGMCPDQELNWQPFLLCRPTHNQLSHTAQGRARLMFGQHTTGKTLLEDKILNYFHMSWYIATPLST